MTEVAVLCYVNQLLHTPILVLSPSNLADSRTHLLIQKVSHKFEGLSAKKLPLGLPKENAM